jgi:hypothetical protein
VPKKDSYVFYLLNKKKAAGLFNKFILKEKKRVKEEEKRSYL